MQDLPIRRLSSGHSSRAGTVYPVPPPGTRVAIRELVLPARLGGIAVPTTHEMIASHPIQPRIEANLIHQCVDACFACVEACTNCADACLAEDTRDELLRCIRIDQDCADICGATGRLITRQLETDWTLLRAQLQTCVLACRQCAAECDKHTQHEHCQMCAAACRECEQACEAVLAATLKMESQVSTDARVEQSFPASDPPAAEGSIAPATGKRT
jgi:hypothetical protein